MAENEIQLKITIDGKDAIATLKLTEDEIKKLKGAMDTAGVEQGFNKSTRAVSQFGNVSKRDLGMFANQMLYSSGVTGRLGSQLSNLATGMLMGGWIGAAFAGFAAIINLVTENTEEASNKMLLLKASTQEVIEAVNGLKQSYHDALVQQEALLKAANLRDYNNLLKDLKKANDEIVKAILAGNTDTEKFWRAQKDRIVTDLGYYESLFKKIGDTNKSMETTRDLLNEITGGRAGRNTNTSGAQGAEQPVTGGEAGNILRITPANKAVTTLSTSVIILNEALKETSYELAQIGAEGARAWLMNVMGINKVNSVLQILILKFGEAIAQALLMRAVGSFLDFVFPGSGAFMAMAEGGSGVVTKPTLFLAGEGGPEAFNFTPMDKMSGSSMQMQKIVVQVEGEFTQKGMDMRSVLRQVEEKLRSSR